MQSKPCSTRSESLLPKYDANATSIFDSSFHLSSVIGEILVPEIDRPHSLIHDFFFTTLYIVFLAAKNPICRYLLIETLYKRLPWTKVFLSLKSSFFWLKNLIHMSNRIFPNSTLSMKFCLRNFQYLCVVLFCNICNSQRSLLHIYFSKLLGKCFRT